MSVAVVVEECTSGAPTAGRIGHARRTGHIRERSVTVVAVEDVLAPVGDEQIVEAVIVIVAHTYAASPTRLQQACPLGHIREAAVPVVFEESIAGARGSVGETGPGEQKNIEPAVVVEVEKGATTTESFDDVIFAVAFTVDCDGPQASFCAYIGESGIERKARRFATGLRNRFVRHNALTQTRRGRGTEQSGEEYSSRSRHEGQPATRYPRYSI